MDEAAGKERNFLKASGAMSGTGQQLVEIAVRALRAVGPIQAG
jgi:hypothetical protein